MSDRPTDKEILTDVTKAKRILDSLASKLADPTKRFPEGLQQDATVTERLRLAISTSGEAQKDVAARAGVDAVALGRFLKGQKDLNGKTIDKLATAMGLELTERKSDR